MPPLTADEFGELLCVTPVSWKLLHLSEAQHLVHFWQIKHMMKMIVHRTNNLVNGDIYWFTYLFYLLLFFIYRPHAVAVLRIQFRGPPWGQSLWRARHQKLPIVGYIMKQRSNPHKFKFSGSKVRKNWLFYCKIYFF